MGFIDFTFGKFQLEVSNVHYEKQPTVSNSLFFLRPLVSKKLIGRALFLLIFLIEIITLSHSQQKEILELSSAFSSKLKIDSSGQIVNKILIAERDMSF
jgi:hypothetical protein